MPGIFLLRFSDHPSVSIRLSAKEDYNYWTLRNINPSAVFGSKIPEMRKEFRKFQCVTWNVHIVFGEIICWIGWRTEFLVRNDETCHVWNVLIDMFHGKLLYATCQFIVCLKCCMWRFSYDCNQKTKCFFSGAFPHSL